MAINILKNPMTRKRLSRFKEVRRAYISLWILAALYAVSLCSELICNDVPLYVRFQGKSYFPIFTFYPEDTFTGNGRKTRPDYKKISRSAVFLQGTDNKMIFPPIPYSPFESIDPSELEMADEATVRLTPVHKIAKADIDAEFRIVKSSLLSLFVGKDDAELSSQSLSSYLVISEDLRQAVSARFENRPSPSVAFTEMMGKHRIEISLSEYSVRTAAPKTVRLTVTQKENEKQTGFKISFNRKGDLIKDSDHIWKDFPNKESLSELVRKRFDNPVDAVNIAIADRIYTAEFIKEDVRFPFRPVKGHFMGIDSAGRDVFARILYGLRTSLTFGLLLTLCSMGFGVIAGAIQGYYGGLIDITAQRVIEIWSALPFLYIMILMGSVYGRSFSLLLFCYGIFNWIGISYYIRAEFLRLRRQPFVEAARCMGLSSAKIIFRHILPNALVPVITFFPFSLVGAIGALAALDYLGFGLPSPTPSWGDLLFQAQQYRWAWWLILYPSLALFLVMLFGVFIGDGIRNAYDPKRYSRLVG